MEQHKAYVGFIIWATNIDLIHQKTSYRLQALSPYIMLETLMEVSFIYAIIMMIQQEMCMP